MGKAIIIPDISFALNNLGTITFIGQGTDEPGGTDEPVIVVPQYNLWDILYTDGNGNLSVSSEVLDVSLGKTPIAICIAKTGFFGENEKARWMALKYLTRATGPNNAQTGGYTIFFGPYQDISEIDNITITHEYSTDEEPDWGRWSDGSSNYPNHHPQVLPNVYDSNGDWNLAELGTVNAYALTDINGKAKTAIYQSYVTTENWQTSEILDNANPGNWPAVEAAWHYAPSGTQQGDWYIGACGEYALMHNLRTVWSQKIAAIKTVYPNACYAPIDMTNTTSDAFQFWTTTERNAQNYRMNIQRGVLGSKSKNEKNNKFAIPLLQY